MLKPILVATTALVIAGSSLVYAQQRFDRGPDRDRPDRAQADRHQVPQLSPEDRAAFMEARIAALRAGLQLTPDQDKNWPAFETAIRDLVKNRRERIEAWHNQQPTNDPTERLKRRADALASAGAALQKLAAAQGPLYASLNDGQKRRFAMLSRRLSGGPGMMGHHGMGQQHQHMNRQGMRDERGGEGWRGGDRERDHHGFRGEQRRSDAEGDRFRDGRGPGWRDDRMDGRGGPDWRQEQRQEQRQERRQERDRDAGGRSMDRDRGPMGGEDRL